MKWLMLLALSLVGPTSAFCEDTQKLIEDAQKQMDLLKQSANEGNVKAQCKLALCYDLGSGVPVDRKESFFWYSKAARKGSAQAQHGLAQCHLHGLGTKKDPKAAFSWYKKAAKQGHGEAALILGKCYYFGIGTGKDLLKARKWVKKALEKKAPLAKDFWETYKLGEYSA